ncbi:acyl-CoA thioesterase [Donghicola tyrosinivorans]|uniref:Acyl-CoA thioester hydrolase n=1 Tax=Donghicola tyrosinivorans TaxID=1652492 RepID=A0A2T0WHD1_9RHOB|nr:thioesterase family protein [Donghicola tyrosinivorans]PRY86072.1 acyl-CoA thioester hydrolase [Donghicola tyrosinivorans]
MSAPVLTAVFHNWHCDHFGHVNVRHYAAAFDDAIFAFWSAMGTAKAGIVPVTAQQTTTFTSEVKAGDVVEITATLTRLGGKSATVQLAMQDAASQTLRATCEVVEVFFDMDTRQSAPMPEAVRMALEAK